MDPSNELWHYKSDKLPFEQVGLKVQHRSSCFVDLSDSAQVGCGYMNNCSFFAEDVSQSVPVPHLFIELSMLLMHHYFGKNESAGGFIIFQNSQVVEVN